jgi:hypothetical protein
LMRGCLNNSSNCLARSFFFFISFKLTPIKVKASQQRISRAGAT